MKLNSTFAGAILGGLAVAAGAFGAHALEDRLSVEALAWWQTAAHYHLAHALALVLVGLAAARGSSRWLTLAGVGFASGVVLFSGSLYALALTGARWLGAVTPAGGLLLLVGWAGLAASAIARPRS